MSRQLLLLGALGAVLPLAGCGNNAPKTGSTTGGHIAATSGSPSAATSGSTNGATQTPTSGGPSSATHVILPATYTLGPSGSLSPSTVSAPKSVPILLTIVSHDAATHHVAIDVKPQPRTLTVPASGRASAKLGVLPPGSYTIAVDGKPRGRLVVGVQPGP
ncbi:MAG TPA: hypothetical protein VMU90_11965 [Solirubrobacteraceae bacterium]|nr:hypothetical protein [Solirubrobacteraceae bacterium]